IYLLIIIAGILMTLTVVFGMKGLVVISFIAVPLITILGSTSVFKAVDSMGGYGALIAYEPAEQIGLAAALTICIGSFISACTLTPDFTRFSRKKLLQVIARGMAFFIVNTLMFDLVPLVWFATV